MSLQNHSAAEPPASTSPDLASVTDEHNVLGRGSIKKTGQGISRWVTRQEISSGDLNSEVQTSLTLVEPCLIRGLDSFRRDPELRETRPEDGHDIHGRLIGEQGRMIDDMLPTEVRDPAKADLSNLHFFISIEKISLFQILNIFKSRKATPLERASNVSSETGEMAFIIQ